MRMQWRSKQGPEVTRLIPEQRALLTGNCAPTEKADKQPGALSKESQTVPNPPCLLQPGQDIPDITGMSQSASQHVLLLGVKTRLNWMHIRDTCIFRFDSTWIQPSLTKHVRPSPHTVKYPVFKKSLFPLVRFDYIWFRVTKQPPKYWLRKYVFRSLANN